MSKSKEILKILRFAKGGDLKNQMNRIYILENGIKTLVNECDSGGFEPTEVIWDFGDPGTNKCKRDFASREEDVDMTPWKPESETK